MFTRIPIFATVLSALATAVAAVPATTFPVPKAIPDQGLPSSASPDTTPVELFEGLPPALLRARAAGQCSKSNTAARDDAVACLDQIWSKRHEDIKVGHQKVVTFCDIRTAVINGINKPGEPVDLTYNDVALSLQWMIVYCNVDGRVGGFQAADGNSGIIVAINST